MGERGTNYGGPIALMGKLQAAGRALNACLTEAGHPPLLEVDWTPGGLILNTEPVSVVWLPGGGWASSGESPDVVLRATELCCPLLAALYAETGRKP